MSQLHVWIVAAVVALGLAAAPHLDPGFDVDQAIADDAAAAPAEVASAARAERIPGGNP